MADDATAVGQLLPLSPLYGYYPNATKTYLIVKSQFFDSAKQLTNVQVTCHGQRRLGAIIGTQLYTEECVSKKVKKWSDEILTFTSIADNHPQSASCAFVHGVVPKWNYVMRAIKSVGSLFHPLEKVIHQHFIPAPIGQDPCLI